LILRVRSSLGVLAFLAALMLTLIFSSPGYAAQLVRDLAAIFEKRFRV
jgi:hypothetical protein